MSPVKSLLYEAHENSQKQLKLQRKYMPQIVCQRMSSWICCVCSITIFPKRQLWFMQLVEGPRGNSELVSWVFVGFLLEKGGGHSFSWKVHLQIKRCSAKNHIPGDSNKVTFWSTSWRPPATIERVTNHHPKKGHKDLPGLHFVAG